MDTRKEQLLASIVEEYIKTTEPVGSKALAGSKISVSPATIRNEMAELERLGFITHPHTSAGRIPTVLGYRYYLDNFVSKKPLAKKDQDFLRQAFSEESDRRVKSLAKAVAEVVSQGVFVAFSKNNVFYSGISNLFAHPEFRDYDFTSAVAEIIDSLEENIESVFSQVKPEGVTVLLGEDNPFGQGCAAAVSVFEGMDEPGVIGVFGPIRMDYKKVMAALEFARDLIQKK